MIAGHARATILAAVLTVPCVAARGEMDAAAYQARADYAAVHEPLMEELRRELGPTRGLYLSWVNDDSVAHHAGLRVGEVITHVDGQRVIENVQLGALHAARAGCELTVVDAAGRPRTVAIPPADRVGITFTALHRSDLWYARHGQRGAWDRDLLAALAAVKFNDFELADEALRRAIETGYEPDDLSRAVQLYAALARADWGQAADLLQRLPGTVDHQAWFSPAMPRYTLGFATGDVEAMTQDVTQLAGGGAVAGADPWPRWLADAARWKKHPAWASDWTRWTQAAAVTRVNHLLRPADVGNFAALPMPLAEPMTGDQPFTTVASPGHYRQGFLRCDMPLTDFELTARFTARLNGPPHKQWPSQLAITVSDAATWDNDRYWGGGNVVAGIHLQADARRPCGWRRVLAGGLTDQRLIANPLVVFDGVTEHEIALRRFGTRCQVLLDGRVLADVPSDPDATGLIVHIHNVGLAVGVLRFELVGISPAASPAD